MIQLVAVVEFEPFDYSEGKIESPNTSRVDDPERWKRYWYESLACAGITELHPIEDTWFVNIDQLHCQKALMTYLDTYFISIENTHDFDEYSPLSGGYVLQYDGHSCVTPGCCGDLSNLTDWKAAVADQTDEWKMLWIGHPWVLYRATGECLEISEPTEADAPPSDTSWVVPKVELRQEIRHAERKLREFGEQLREALSHKIPDGMIHDVATIMLEGHFVERGME